MMPPPETRFLLLFVMTLWCFPIVTAKQLKALQFPGTLSSEELAFRDDPGKGHQMSSDRKASNSVETSTPCDTLPEANGKNPPSGALPISNHVEERFFEKGSEGRRKSHQLSFTQVKLASPDLASCGLVILAGAILVLLGLMVLGDRRPTSSPAPMRYTRSANARAIQVSPPKTANLPPVEERRAYLASSVQDKAARSLTPRSYVPQQSSVLPALPKTPPPSVPQQVPQQVPEVTPPSTPPTLAQIPPLCPGLIVENREVKFDLSVAPLLEGTGTSAVYGSNGNALLLARVLQGRSGRVVELAVNNERAETLASVGASNVAGAVGALEVRGAYGKPYGMLRPTQSGGYLLSHGDTEVFTLVSDRSNSQMLLFPSSGSDPIAMAKRFYKPLKSSLLAPFEDSNAAGDEHIELTARPHVDALLALACVLAVILVGGGSALSTPGHPPRSLPATQ